MESIPEVQDFKFSIVIARVAFTNAHFENELLNVHRSALVAENRSNYFLETIFFLKKTIDQDL